MAGGTASKRKWRTIFSSVTAFDVIGSISTRSAGVWSSFRYDAGHAASAGMASPPGSPKL
eukprot:5238619-Prymnesium_polylepis.2